MVCKCDSLRGGLRHFRYICILTLYVPVTGTFSSDLMVHNHYYVITGGPGVGKTTLLGELEKRNYRCMPEVARRVIQEQMA